MASLLAQLSLFVVLASGERASAPPGTVLVPGGNTKIGSELKDVERRLEFDANSQRYAASLSAETPQFTMNVPAFHLMVTEVTNEQYATFVGQRLAKPPAEWGEAAIARGRELWFQDQERTKADARTAGLRTPDLPAFDAGRWWDDNWTVSPWEIPAGDERRPVVFVSYADARAYARWAGMRLPTEFEYQRAVRGDYVHDYPWGDDWDSERYAATSLLKKKSSAHPVGSFPAGASKNGVFDLAGNVWEWTSSAYLPYSGYEPKVYEFGYGTKKRHVNAVADWNGAQRVLVGGSHQNGNLMARGSTRRAADVAQATDAVGFRCAASTRPGYDAATFVLEEDLLANLRAHDSRGSTDYATESTVAVEKWTTEPPMTSASSSAPPPGYARIASYEHVLFTPVRAIPATEMTPLLRTCAREGPVELGFLSTSVAIADPELAAGVYRISWRPKGEPAFAAVDGVGGGGGSVVGDGGDGSGSGAGSDGGADGRSTARNDARSRVPLEEALALDVAYDQLIFTALDGTPVRAMRAELAYGALREGSVDWLEAAPSTDAPGEHATAKVLRFDLSIACRTTKKGFNLVVPLAIAGRDIERIGWP